MIDPFFPFFTTRRLRTALRPPVNARNPIRMIRRGCAAGFVALLVLLAGSCTLGKNKVLIQREDWIEVYAIDMNGPPPPPPDPAFAAITPLQVRRSLRRITVRHSEILLFLRSDPKPLLTEEQVDYMRDVLVRELPALQPGRRIEFVFRDQFKGGLVDVEVYPEGEYLVYRFQSLARRLRDRSGPGPDPPNLAILEPVGNQIVEEGSFPVLKDPVFAAPGAEEEEEVPF